MEPAEQAATLRALRTLAAKCLPTVGPTVSVIAAEAGQSYRQTERVLRELAQLGLVVKLKEEKSDGFAERYQPVDTVGEALTLIEEYCPACDQPWEDCRCPRLVQLGGGVIPAEPDPWKGAPS